MSAADDAAARRMINRAERAEALAETRARQIERLEDQLARTAELAESRLALLAVAENTCPFDCDGCRAEPDDEPAPANPPCVACSHPADDHSQLSTGCYALGHSGCPCPGYTAENPIETGLRAMGVKP